MIATEFHHVRLQCRIGGPAIGNGTDLAGTQKPVCGHKWKQRIAAHEQDPMCPKCMGPCVVGKVSH